MTRNPILSLASALFFSASLFAPSALADILFLNYNNAPAEIAAARRAAAARGEDLIVLPEVEAELQKKLDQGQAIYEREAERLKSSKSCKGLEMRKRCQVRVDQALGAYKDLTKNVTLDDTVLKKELEARLPKISHLSSIIVSGHGATTVMGGDFGGVSDKALAEIFSKFPQHAESIRSLYLWGCYTAVPGALEFNWKKAFPNVQMVAGYDGKGASRIRKAGQKYLEEALKREAKLIQAADEKKLKALADEFFDIPGTRSTLAAAISFDCVFVNRQGAKSNEEHFARCRIIDEAGLKTFQCHYEAKEPGCENPPKDDSSSLLRKYYNLRQSNKSCSNIPAVADLYKNMPHLDVIIRLIKFPHVLGNFVKHLNKELDETEGLLRKAGVPEEISVKDLAGKSRAQILAMIDRAKELSQSVLKDSPQGDNESRRRKHHLLHFLADSLETSLVKLPSSSIPFSWVDDHARDPKGEYFPKLGKELGDWVEMHLKPSATD